MTFERTLDFRCLSGIIADLFFAHAFLIFHYAEWILVFSAPIALKNWHDIQTTTDAKDTFNLTTYDDLFFALSYMYVF